MKNKNAVKHSQNLLFNSTTYEPDDFLMFENFTPACLQLT